MCAEFMIRASESKISRQLGVVVKNETGQSEWRRHVRLYTPAPVIRLYDGEFVCKEMMFSLKPKGTPYSTFNARILGVDERKNEIVPIYSKRTWKEPFIKRRCVVPMTAFIEPIYLGEHAGEAVEFHEVSDEILFCAAIYDSSIDKETGEAFDGFSLLIHTPSDFVLEVGHHRQPLFLQPSAIEEWLTEDEIDPEWGVEFLQKKRLLPDLKVKTNRRMAKGWEKRVSENKRKHNEELEFRRML